MNNLRWIFALCFVLSFQKSLTQKPGHCEIIDSYLLNCNNVTQEEVNDRLSKDYFITDINIYNMEIETFDSNYFIDGVAEKTDSLALNDDQITEITADAFQGYSVLYFLQINRNLLTSLPTDLFNGLNQLESLSIQDCQLARLEKNTFANLPNLTTLYLGGNPIETIENGTFTNLSKFVDLDISSASIEDFPTYAFKNAKISNLRLENNSIRHLERNAFENLPVLSELNLAHNFMHTLPNGIFSNTPHLHVLTLKSNLMTTFSPKDLSLPKNLLNLDLSFNALTGLDLTEFNEVFPHLQSLYLGYNPWKCNNLQKMLEDSIKLDAYIWWGKQNAYNFPNVKGIPCIPDIPTTTITSTLNN